MTRPTPSVTVRGGVDAPVGHSCALCRADISALRAGARFCSTRCRVRAQRGMPAPTQARAYGARLAHPGYVVEPCPACGYPEADGGWCADCGWTITSPAGAGWTDWRAA